MGALRDIQVQVPVLVLTLSQGAVLLFHNSAVERMGHKVVDINNQIQDLLVIQAEGLLHKDLAEETKVIRATKELEVKVVVILDPKKIEVKMVELAMQRVTQEVVQVVHVVLVIDKITDITKCMETSD